MDSTAENDFVRAGILSFMSLALLFSFQLAPLPPRWMSNEFHFFIFVACAGTSILLFFKNTVSQFAKKSEINCIILLIPRLIIRISACLFVIGLSIIIIGYGGIARSPYAVLLTLSPFYFATKASAAIEREMFKRNARTHLKEHGVRARDVKKYLRKNLVKRTLIFISVLDYLIRGFLILVILFEVFYTASQILHYPEDYIERLLQTPWHRYITYSAFASAMAIAYLTALSSMEWRFIIERWFRTE